jgi:hypothetical protein
MEIHEKFTEWAIEKGVQINGIRPHRFEGRGLGIIAERDFKVRRRSFALVFLRVVSFVLSTWLQVNHSYISSSFRIPYAFLSSTCGFNPRYTPEHHASHLNSILQIYQ